MGDSLNTKEQRKQRCPLKAHGFVSFVPLCLKKTKQLAVCTLCVTLS